MAGAAYSGNSIMILSRNFTGVVYGWKTVLITIPEQGRGNLQRNDPCRYNRKWREYQVSGRYHDPVPPGPVTGAVCGIFPGKVGCQG